MSKFRKNMSKRHSKKLFSKTADLNRIHPKNAYMTGPMRGGIRL